MSWVNLNDTYVNKTGDTIAGDLSVNGALNVNDGKGTRTTYNVANEITALRDHASKLNVRDSVDNIQFIHNNDNDHREIWFDDTCIYFDVNYIGVYNSTTQQGFQINKS